MDAGARGLLKHEVVNQFIDELGKADTPENKLLDYSYKQAFDTAKQSIVGLIPSGEKSQSLTNWSYDAKSVLSQASKTMKPLEIREKYLNPRSPDYIASKERLHQYGASQTPLPMPGVPYSGKLPTTLPLVSPITGEPQAATTGVKSTPENAYKFMFGGQR